MDQEVYWNAVVARDWQFDTRFVYGVRSTGIYCRPTCPSRRPRRDQVLFFERPESAEQAGFRPCRRCRPRIRGADPRAALVQGVCRFIEEHSEERLSLDALSRNAGFSPHHLQRTFKRALGITPREYADAVRLGRLKGSLKGGEDVTTALYKAGYGSSSRLYERADPQLGMTPATYRKGGHGMSIAYTITDTRFGRVLVAWTERGVCALSLGAEDKPLEKFLREEYPHADIHRDDTGVTAWIRNIVTHLDGRCMQVDLPVDVQATAFQRLVWQKLQEIPYGETRTYSQIAKEMGRPTATRAVARACATNPVSIVIPCHRVVREDGGMGGYRWGIERKRALLNQEREKHPGGQR